MVEYPRLFLGFAEGVFNVLYVGARYAQSVYGVVDTDDGTMSSVDSASLVKYVTEYGLEIKGVERKGEHTARINVITDPAITGLRNKVRA